MSVPHPETHLDIYTCRIRNLLWLLAYGVGCAGTLEPA